MNELAILGTSPDNWEEAARGQGRICEGQEHAGGNAVASPEPAVGVFTTAGTCQGRLRRHFVIGSAAP